MPTDTRHSTAAPQELTALIGNTPLLKLKRLSAHLPQNIEVYIKAEWFNPGGSVKDRAAWSIVRAELASGRLQPGGTLLDASSGNTGIAYAMLGAALGFRVVLCVPQNANRERKQTLRAYGAELILTDPNDGSDGAILKARELSRAHPNYVYVDQYSNEENWKAHYTTTGPEIHTQTQGRLTHFISGLGTSGTCMGTGRYIRAHLPKAKVIAFQPNSPFHGLEGMKHMASAIIPPIYDSTICHEDRPCATEDAYEMVRALGQQEGMLVGISSGAALHIGLAIAQEEAEKGAPACIVCMAPDGGDRYLSDNFWTQD